VIFLQVGKKIERKHPPFLGGVEFSSLQKQCNNHCFPFVVEVTQYSRFHYEEENILFLNSSRKRFADAGTMYHHSS